MCRTRIHAKSNLFFERRLENECKISKAPNEVDAVRRSADPAEIISLVEPIERLKLLPAVPFHRCKRIFLHRPVMALRARSRSTSLSGTLKAEEAIKMLKPVRT